MYIDWLTVAKIYVIVFQIHALCPPQSHSYGAFSFYLSV